MILIVVLISLAAMFLACSLVSFGIGLIKNSDREVEAIFCGISFSLCGVLFALISLAVIITNI